MLLIKKESILPNLVPSVTRLYEKSPPSNPRGEDRGVQEGLPPEFKYEQNFGNSRDVAHIRDGVSLPKLFDFANQCINPVKTKQQIYRSTCDEGQFLSQVT